MQDSKEITVDHRGIGFPVYLDTSEMVAQLRKMGNEMLAAADRIEAQTKGPDDEQTDQPAQASCDDCDSRSRNDAREVAASRPRSSIGLSGL